MAEKPISKEYLLTQLKNFEGVVLKNEFVQKVTTLPTASAEYVGKIMMFIGASDATYTNGYFYECKLNEGAYSWVQKNVQPQVDPTNIINDSTTENDKTWSSYKINSELGDKLDSNLGLTESGKILKVDEDGDIVAVTPDSVPVYSIISETTPTTGSVATYKLTKDGVATGVAIEIPKDKYVSSASISDNILTLTVANGTDVTVDLSDYEVAEYTIAKKTTAEEGYIASYELKKDGVATGDTINIPKDFLVKSAKVVTATKYASGTAYEKDDLVIYTTKVYRVDTSISAQDNTQFSDLDVTELSLSASSKKYIDFIINVKEGTATDDEHLYLDVNDLVDVYSGGNGITVGADNSISVKVVNGDTVALSFDTSGNLKAEVINETVNIDFENDWND